MTDSTSVPPRPPHRRIDRWGLFVGVVASIGMVMALARVGQLQVAPERPLVEHIAQRESTRPIPAERGQLLDRRGRVLATSRFVYRVVVDPLVLPADVNPVIEPLARTIGAPADEVGGRIVTAMAVNAERLAARREMGVPDDDAAGPRSLRDVFIRRLGLEEPDPLGVVLETETDGQGELVRPPVPIRYLPIGPELEQEVAIEVQKLRIPGVRVERLPQRDYPAGDLAAAIVGKAGLDNRLDEVGLIGAEARFDAKLAGADGSLTFVRDALGRALWVERGAWREGQPGPELRLSIDLEIQRIAAEELTRGVEEADAQGGKIVVMDPATGEVLAMHDVIREVPEAEEFPWAYRDEQGLVHAPTVEEIHRRRRVRVVAPDERRAVEPALARNRCVEDVYEPGSTFKPFVWAAAKSRGLLPDAEVLRQSENIYRTPYGRSVEDVTFKTELTWDDVLKYSSNIGMVQAGERLSFEQARNTIRALGFGSAAGTGLPGETPGLVTSARNWTAYTQTSISMGYEVGVTPVQMVRAFSVFARNGGLAGTLPSVRLTAAGPADRPGRTGEPVIAERVYDPAVAVRTRQPLKTVADRLDDLMKRHFKGDPEPSYVMFGKSGTSKIAAVPPKGKLRPRGAPGYFEKQYTTSFLAGAPLEEPRIVVLVVIDDPGPELVRTLRYYGSWTAGPVVRRVTERTLRYLGVPPDRAETDVVAAAEGMRD